jgi:hypothetical protein
MHEAYGHISHLFLLACKAEEEIVLYNYTCTEHMAYSSSFSSALHDDQEHNKVKLVIVFPSSQEELIVDPCYSEDLWDNDSLVLRQQLVNEYVTFDIEPNILAKKEHVICIANKTEELKLLSSLNTWGYIEFDDLCELSNLDNIFFDRSTMPCPSHATFYIAGKYNKIGQFLVHRVYISSIYGVSLHCANKILVCSPEEEKLLFPCTLVEVPGLFLEDQDKTSVMNINHDAKPRTVCCQEGENDENITRSEMTMLMAPTMKVKLFHIVTTFDVFEELILRHKVYILLFVELITWIKRCVNCTTKALRYKEVDRGPSNDISNIPNQATTSC